jgi:hypothetical protein
MVDMAGLPESNANLTEITEAGCNGPFERREARNVWLRGGLANS